MIIRPANSTVLLILGVLLPILLGDVFYRSTTNYANLQLVAAVIDGRVAESTKASLYLQGVVAFRQQQYPDAVTLLQQIDPRNVLARWFLAQAQDRLGDWEVALRNFDLRQPIECELFGRVLFSHLPALAADKQQQWKQ